MEKIIIVIIIITCYSRTKESAGALTVSGSWCCLNILNFAEKVFYIGKNPFKEYFVYERASALIMLQVQDLGNCFPIYLARQTPDQVLLSHRCSCDTFPRGLPFLFFCIFWFLCFYYLLFVHLFIYLFILVIQLQLSPFSERLFSTTFYTRVLNPTPLISFVPSPGHYYFQQWL